MNSISSFRRLSLQHRLVTRHPPTNTELHLWTLSLGTRCLSNLTTFAPLDLLRNLQKSVMKNTKNIEHFHHFTNTKSFSDSPNKIQISQTYSPNIFTPFTFDLATHTRSHHYHNNCQSTCYTLVYSRYRIISWLCSDKPGDPETLQNHSVGAIQ